MKEKKCHICGNSFIPRRSLQKSCSVSCMYKARKGVVSKKRNGKTIKCKTCGKEFYISGSRIGVKKYCSFQCLKEDNMGFNPKEKKCVICGKHFMTTNRVSYYSQKTCSMECHRKNAYEKSSAWSKKRKELKCNICGKVYTRREAYRGIGLCDKCRYDKLSSERIGENNPSYIEGKHIHRNRPLIRKSKVTLDHMAACRRYRVKFESDHDYPFCEVCGKNENGTYRLEVHHLYKASLYPRHKELHNFKNLILVCLECHHKFHNGEYKKEFLEIEEKRGLKELFKKCPKK